VAERADVRTVSRRLPGPRTVAVVNRKGGANKTPTVALLAAVLARHGGGPVLAWDNNESQGTLGWRTEQGPHTASVLDLVDSSTRLLSPETSTADLAHFVHHQPADKYDVLHSDGNDEVTAEEVDTAHRVASRFYRMIVMDSGNTARSANWRAMVERTDQLVVPVTAMEDRAEAALLTLQTLESRGGHDAELARGAVVIVSESTDAARGHRGRGPGRAGRRPDPGRVRLGSHRSLPREGLRARPVHARHLGPVRGEADPFDPKAGIAALGRYLKAVRADVAHLGSTETERIDLTLAGYSAGPGAVLAHGGVPPFPETQNYVRTVNDLAQLDYSADCAAPGGSVIGDLGTGEWTHPLPTSSLTSRYGYRGWALTLDRGHGVGSVMPLPRG
jgi:MinD-like ATPase involved in chromosome partitioning or flagellar assembly